MSSNAGKVLYVDDDSIVRQVFETTFGRMFDVHVVESGEAALQYLERNSVAVLVTDQRMPGMNGQELLKMVSERFPRVVRIIITAHEDLDAILSAVNQGLVARYMIKPWDLDELAETLRWGVAVHASIELDPALRVRLMNVEKLATLGGLLAGVLHDIGGPLSYLTGNTERLSHFKDTVQLVGKFVKDNPNCVSSEAQEQFVEFAGEFDELIGDMREGCAHLVDICKGMRSLVRSDAVTQSAPADIEKAVRYSVSVGRHRASETLSDEQRCVFELNAPKDIPRVKGSFPALVQVMVNLMTNAVEGIQRAERSGKVSISLHCGESDVRVTVRDNGCGIPAAYLPKVMDPFFTTRGQGTGLGLSQCRRLIESSGGEFRIESEEDVQTTVSFSLPRA